MQDLIHRLQRGAEKTPEKVRFQVGPACHTISSGTRLIFTCDGWKATKPFYTPPAACRLVSLISSITGWVSASSIGNSHYVRRRSHSSKTNAVRNAGPPQINTVLDAAIFTSNSCPLASAGRKAHSRNRAMGRRALIGRSLFPSSSAVRRRARLRDTGPAQPPPKRMADLVGNTSFMPPLQLL